MSDFWCGAVSVRGTAHERSGKPCEDAHFIGENDDGSFVLVACDGAGSRRFGQLGATHVAPAVGRVLLSNASQVMARRMRPEVVLDVAVATIERLAAEQGGGATVEDFACTLVAALVHDRQMMTVHVGDGAVFVLEGEHPRCVSAPDSDPNGGSLTRFVTCEAPMPRMFLYQVPDYWTGILCVTDGASTLLNNVTGACSGVVARALNRFDLGDSRTERERDLRDLVVSELQARSEDDITVVGARRAFVSGLYGCPECRMPSVDHRVCANGTAFYGRCRKCEHQAFYHDENVAQTMASYERVARAAGVALKVGSRSRAVNKAG